jgi:hypothetical protein
MQDPTMVNQGASPEWAKTAADFLRNQFAEATDLLIAKLTAAEKRAVYEKEKARREKETAAFAAAETPASVLEKSGSCCRAYR